jgi:RHS repeat-associated protein
LGGATYAFDVQYDAFDRPSLLSYPQVGTGAGTRPRFSLRYDYNGSGYLYRAVRPTSFFGGLRVSEALWWSVKDVDAAGVALVEQFGGAELAPTIGSNAPPAILTSRFVDKDKRLRRQQTIAGSTTLQSLAYDYGKGSLMKTRYDGITHTTEDFEYDFLERLKRWTVYQQCAKSVLDYGYDDLGNLTSRTVVEGRGVSVVNQYGGKPNAGPHALTTSTEGSSLVLQYGYQRGGRQTTGPGRTVSFTHFDLPASIQGASGNATFKYDGLHRRVERMRPNGETTTYVSGLYEKRAQPSANRHTFHLGFGDLEWTEAGGQVTERLVFFHPDTLGTPDTITGLDGKVVERVKYEPFGQRRFPHDLPHPVSLPSTRSTGFTGHEADDDFGLINMRGRMYDSRTGRFLTADPYVQAPLHSQSLNRYSYVFNNPVNLVDPSGFQALGISGSAGGGGGSGGNAGAGYDPSFDLQLRLSGANVLLGLGSHTVPVAQDASGAQQAPADVGPGSAAGSSGAVPVASVEFGNPGAVAVPYELPSLNGWNPSQGERPAFVPPGMPPGFCHQGFCVPERTSLRTGVLPVERDMAKVAAETKRSVQAGGAILTIVATLGTGGLLPLLGGAADAAVVTLAAGEMFSGAMSTVAETGEVDPMSMVGGALGAAVIGPIGAGSPLARGALDEAGRLIPWSSKSVRDAAQALEWGNTTVRVGSRAEAEELFLGMYQGHGYVNTTNFTPTQTKAFFGTKSGTYHWDIGVPGSAHPGPHLQVHEADGTVIRIFYP